MTTPENKRSGARFNLFDVILILVIIACIAGIVLHAYFTKDLAETYSEPAKISFTISGVSEETALAFCKEGASVYDAKTDMKLGTLDAASYTALPLELENSDGMLVQVTHPNKKMITGTASFVGTWTDDGFCVGGTSYITVGQTINIYTDHAVCIITVTAISR